MLGKNGFTSWITPLIGDVIFSKKEIYYLNILFEKDVLFGKNRFPSERHLWGLSQML
jgi:hypothetical protein